MTAQNFDSLNLPEKIAQALKSMGFTTPTPVQAQAIPAALSGRDVLASAQTGSGKTAAFSIPMIAKLMSDPSSSALVLAPTRELAAQTMDVVNKLTGNNRDMRTALLIGGEGMGKQFEQLRRDPRIIIGTPGRINDHLRRNPDMLAYVNFIAIDEADRMLDMGFSVQIDEIFKKVREDRQMVMFSATFPESIIKFSRNYLNDPVRVSVAQEKASAPKIKHDMVRTTDGEKYTHLLAELEAREGSVIIFVKTQHGTDRLAKRLEKDGHDGVAIHGGLRQNQRDKAVRAFRQQRARIMIATDVAARGLDIPHIEHVINYDLPQVAEDYIHRIGRTARAGAEGNAMCFVTPSEGGKWNAINRILNPGAAPIRTERGGDARPNRGYAGKGGQGGYKGKQGGFKGRDGDRDGSREDRGGASFGKKPYDKKPYEKKEWRNDRNGDSSRPAARADRPYKAQGDKPFVKYARNDDPPRGDTRPERRPSEKRAAWNDRGGKDSRPSQDRPNRDRPGFEKGGHNKGNGGHRQPSPFKSEMRGEDRNAWKSEGRGDGRMDNTRKPAPRGDRNDRGDRGDKFADRGGDRNFGHGGEKGLTRKPGGNRISSKTYFRVDDHGGQKASEGKKSAGKPAAKKPFKFKEHSRKPGRSGPDKSSAAV